MSLSAALPSSSLLTGILLIVSAIVDTATNKVIGSELKSWDKDYGKYDHVNTCPNGPPQEQTDFNITMPDLGDQCTEGGKCVIQW